MYSSVNYIARPTEDSPSIFPPACAHECNKDTTISILKNANIWDRMPNAMQQR